MSSAFVLKFFSVKLTETNCYIFFSWKEFTNPILNIQNKFEKYWFKVKNKKAFCSLGKHVLVYLGQLEQIFLTRFSIQLLSLISTLTGKLLWNSEKQQYFKSVFSKSRIVNYYFVPILSSMSKKGRILVDFCIVNYKFLCCKFNLSKNSILSASLLNIEKNVMYISKI